MEGKLVQVHLVLTCTLLLMALTARSVWPGKRWEGEGLGFPRRKNSPLPLWAS